MRRIGTGLFSAGAALYKARLPAGLADADGAFATLANDGIERNLSMTVLSVVVPVKDEAGNAAPLAHEIAAALAGEPSFEIVFVDDGSADATAAELLALKAEMPSLRVIQHGRNIGQSRAIRTGVRAAHGEIVATLDGDGQNDPADIPRLLAVLRAAHDAERVGLVSGVRVHRQDTANKRLASGFANRFRSAMLKDGAVDAGCGLKAFRRDAYLALPYFDHMHRFLIALMLREGYDVRYVEVEHRRRRHGASKYKNIHRAAVGLIDTFGVRWLQKRFRGTVEAKEL
jgi:dolichol-phosphate mannosyltransferase